MNILLEAVELANKRKNADDSYDDPCLSPPRKKIATTLWQNTTPAKQYTCSTRTCSAKVFCTTNMCFQTLNIVLNDTDKNVAEADTVEGVQVVRKRFTCKRGPIFTGHQCRNCLKPQRAAQCQRPYFAYYSRTISTTADTTIVDDKVAQAFASYCPSLVHKM